MTKKEFKAEVVHDLVYQAEHKTRPYTSEHWYLSDAFYPLGLLTKKKAISELIQEGFIRRTSSVDFYPDRAHFNVLVLVQCLQVVQQS